MKKKVMIIIITAFLTGCANSKIIYQPTLNKADEFSEIIVYRNYMFLGSALLTNLSIDGIPTAEFEGGEWVSIKVNPGEHIITSINQVNVSIADRKTFDSNAIYYFDATYERRREAGVLPEVDAISARKAIETMKKVN